MGPVKSAFFNDTNMIDSVYGHGRKTQVETLTDLFPDVVSSATFEQHAARLADTEVVFSTWGMPVLREDQIRRLPSLKAVFYAAGSVKFFARPYLERGIPVSSAWGANAVSVAEFCLAQILLACKGYFPNTRDCRVPAQIRQQPAFRGRGAYGETVALIGAGQIGRRLIDLLKPFRLNVLVVDPYLSGNDAQSLGVTKATLEEAFRNAYVVSNHLPNLPDLQHVLDGKLFASMRYGATFLNTGRGAQVNEPDMIAVWKQRPDLLALLDVTDPEPPDSDSELYKLPNVQLSSHIAGAHDDEVLRMADTIIEEFKRWRDGQPLSWSVTLEMLDRLA